jgi:hypothetical protein
MTEVSQPTPSQQPEFTGDYATEPFMAEAVELDQISLADAMSVVSVLDPRNTKKDISIDDYEFLGGNPEYRKQVKAAYLGDGVEGVPGLVPNHDYPILDEVTAPQQESSSRYMELAVTGAQLVLGEKAVGGEGVRKTYVFEGMSGLDAEHSRLQIAYMRISKALESGEISGEKEVAYAELVLRKQEVEMMKIEMLQAAESMRSPKNGDDRELAREVFMDRNEKLYGPLDKPAYKGIIAQELDRVASFEPQDEGDQKLFNSVTDLLKNQLESLEDFEAFIPEIDPETLEVMTPIVLEHFKDFIDTWDEFGYQDQLTSEQFAERVKAIFDKAGLSDMGCKVILDNKATTVNVSGPAREIRIPGSDAIAKYNSDWLLSIVMHEYGHLYRSVVTQQESPDKALLAKGTPNYLGPEEGMNAFIQIILLKSRGQDVSEVLQLWQDRYLVYGLATGADGKERAAVETLRDSEMIETLRKRMAGVEQKEASQKARAEMNVHVERFFRGSPFSDPGTVYAKDKVYYDGLVKNIPFFNELAKKPPEEIRRILKVLYFGKIDHTDPSEYELSEKLAA